MNKNFLWCLLGSSMLLTGCTHNISGDYVSQDELLQITEGSDGKLLGTLNRTIINTDGTSYQSTFNLSGITDGKSITLISKENVPFAVSTNMSGTVSDGLSHFITIMNHGDVKQFNKSSASEYQTNMQNLRVEVLTSAINNDTDKIKKGLIDFNKASTKFHNEANDLLVSAKKESAKIDQQRNQSSVVIINQDYFQFLQVWISWSQQINSMYSNYNKIGNLDTAIAQSPCHNGQDNLSMCKQQLVAERNYQAEKKMVSSEIADIKKMFTQEMKEMKEIIQEVDNN